MQPYLDEVSTKLSGLLAELPKAERDSEMAECQSAAESSGFLNSTPRTDSPQTFVQDLLSDPGMSRLVEQDSKNKVALSAESPSELVLNLLPSDGHLD